MNDPVYEGLSSFFDDSFPKKCSVCGKVYHSSQQFFAETSPPAVSNKSLKSSEEDGEVVVEAFRNCQCGSTLMDVFSNRRDTSEKGMLRRKKFEQVLHMLTEQGLEPGQAKQKLQQFLRTGESSVIQEAIKKKTSR
ncbi:oxidoreductase [Litoribrevibacter albus]|uniref:Uncharacterized protein n=1 Tax=Litoribrevibacter albus TaxID=1473156 RepID=A0AA37W7U4_9GAMM|nr:oxidoreductase [Litoribrevibacter albus]GLQ31768.1 hypothetical protein GCM10007876_22470 [Litoribrevibacter albus]